MSRANSEKGRFLLCCCRRCSVHSCGALSQVILVNMSTSALDLVPRVSARSRISTVGIKAVMAITGVVLFGYVIGHLLGNLQIFLPDAKEDLRNYAAMLHR